MSVQHLPQEKGVYEPPMIENYPNIKKRTIKISNYIDKRISHFIGKGGRHFIEWTKEFNVLYIFYRNREIEIWGEKEENIHRLIHFLVDKIKKMNAKRNEMITRSEE